LLGRHLHVALNLGKIRLHQAAHHECAVLVVLAGSLGYVLGVASWSANTSMSATQTPFTARAVSGSAALVMIFLLSCNHQ
jgi:uncharacterized membrane protein YidH (DUF202 family)